MALGAARNTRDGRRPGCNRGLHRMSVSYSGEQVGVVELGLVGEHVGVRLRRDGEVTLADAALLVDVEATVVLRFADWS